MTRNRTNIPEIHVYLDSTLAQLANPGSASTSSGRKHAWSDASDSSSSDDLEKNTVPILSVLEMLHKKFPDANYPQYVDAFRKQGIFYAKAVCDLDASFFAKEVGMPRGVVGEFVRVAKQMVKGKGRKHVRVDDSEKENYI